MNNRSMARFKDAPWFGHQRITIGGVGGIGSWVAFLMARMGHELFLYDNDKVEEVNLGGQLYGRDYVGQFKTNAAKDIIWKFCENDQVHLLTQFTDESEGTSKMISCFDNMAARMVFFKKWQHYKEKVHQTAKEVGIERDPCLFIDGRLEAETAIIYCIRTPEEEKMWLDEWFPDENVPNAPCTFRATSHNAAIIAGLMTAALNNAIVNHKEGLDVRVVPWKTTYELPTFTFEAKETSYAN